MLEAGVEKHKVCFEDVYSCDQQHCVLAFVKSSQYLVAVRLTYLTHGLFYGNGTDDDLLSACWLSCLTIKGAVCQRRGQLRVNMAVFSILDLTGDDLYKDLLIELTHLSIFLTHMLLLMKIC